MTSTEKFVGTLTRLKTGDLGLLRTHAGKGLDESVDGFDLFAGIWWPLRKKNQSAPRREVAWLITKLYASCPVEQSPGDLLSRQLRLCQPTEERQKERFRKRFDEMLSLPLAKIEPSLRWALEQIASSGKKVDWAKLTGDLSNWEHETTRLGWAEHFLETIERR